MKNKSKILIGSFLSIITFCLTLCLSSINEANAQEELTHADDSLYKPSVCWSQQVPYAQCITPEKLGPCARIVKCP